MTLHLHLYSKTLLIIMQNIWFDKKTGGACSITYAWALHQSRCGSLNGVAKGILCIAVKIKKNICQRYTSQRCA